MTNQQVYTQGYCAGVNSTLKERSYILELACNIRRNLRKVDRMLGHGNDEDSSMIDMIAQTDTLAEQIEVALDEI